MNIPTIIITGLGLALFEIVSSVDNAVINAEVLETMDGKSRKWFLGWGLLFAVLVVRGLLPWLIIWIATPGLGPIQALVATFSNDPHIAQAITHATPILLAGGGTFLAFLFLHWLFLETKVFGLPHEHWFAKFSAWFYVSISILLICLVWFGIQTNETIAYGAVTGALVFFVTYILKQNAEKQESTLTKTSTRSDLAKIIYLEIIDATFSIDGVLGAFAFTLSVPLIVIGNGIGALVLRQLTVGNIDTIKKYVYLKNGAMYSIGALGVVMLATAFGATIPEWVSPLLTFVIVGFFFWKSKQHLR